MKWLASWLKLLVIVFVAKTMMFFIIYTMGDVIMPNYEELYNIARNKYNQAIEDRNAIRRNKSELQGKKNTLTRELGGKQATLVAIQQKKLLIQEAVNKCKSIIDGEYPAMKRDLQSTSEEFKRIISTDRGVADLSSIYSSDISSTQSNLNAIFGELNGLLSNFSEQERVAQASVKTCINELSTVSTQLNNVGNEYEAQRRINSFYTQMKEYESRWLNGE